MTSQRTTDTSQVSRRGPDDAPAKVRLNLTAEPDSAGTMLDGAWWPRSHSLVDELPALITELHRRGPRITRAVYNPATWDPAPHKLAADGHVVRLGWFDRIDPHLVSLTGSYGTDRIELLVIPPETTPDTAATAMKQAATPGNRSTPSEVLRISGAVTAGAPAVAPPLVTTTDPNVAAWESEGGHLSR